VEAAGAGRASTVVDGGLDGDMLARFEVRNIRADFEDCAGEFVAERYWEGFFSERVRFYWGKCRACMFSVL
jgi:hypothetical protein